MLWSLMLRTICNEVNRSSFIQPQIIGWIGKGVKGSDNGLIWCTIPDFYAGDEKIHNISVTVAGLRAEIWKRVHTNTKRQCHIFENDVILGYSYYQMILTGLYVYNPHLTPRNNKDGEIFRRGKGGYVRPSWRKINTLRPKIWIFICTIFNR
jgi:hypothetical protein